MSCGPNEIWSWGPATQESLTKYVLLRAAMKPYIEELSRNVSKYGVPVVRPLWWEFPRDENCYDVNDQYFFGPSILVAPVTERGATSRSMYFPSGANWINIFDGTTVEGGTVQVVEAPVDIIPVYKREFAKFPL
jgi:alpha-D-xyloside xylohydrolase